MNPRLRRWGPLGRVRHVISMAMVFTVINIVLVINTFFLQKKIPFTGGVFFSFYVLIALAYLVVSLIFKRNVLARSIRLYKGSKLAKYGGAIGLFYTLLNLVVILTMVFGVKMH